MTRMGVRKMNGFLGSGVLAFLLFIVYDFNEVRWRKRWLHGLFFAGFALLVLASVGLAVQAACLAAADSRAVFGGAVFGTTTVYSFWSAAVCADVSAV